MHNDFRSLVFSSFDFVGEAYNYYFLNKQEGLITQIPTELIQTIFVMSRENLANIALVCKNWYVKAIDEKFIGLPSFIFGKQDWCEKLNATPKNVPHLPFCAYGFEKCMVTLIPDIVEIKNEDGSIKDEQFSVPLFGELIKNANSEHKIFYDYKNSDLTLTDMTRKNVTACWIVIEEEAIGKGLEFPEQNKRVKNKGKGVYIPDELKTIVSVATRYIKTGELFLSMSRIPAEWNWSPENIKSTVLRLEEPEGTPTAISIYFPQTKESLKVDGVLTSDPLICVQSQYAYEVGGYVGVAVAGKPSEPVKNGTNWTKWF